jgi:phosphatidylglycerophosphate synthase
LVASGVRDRLGLAGWLGCGVLIVAASALDWLDGPLARRLGPTKLGAALDIEADSWLTLWAGAAAVAWGGLPWVVMVAPLLHYLHPIRAWLAGRLPQSDGLAWARVPGAAQMLLFAAALLPVAGAGRDMVLAWASYPIAATQSLTMLLTLAFTKLSRTFL